MQPEHILSFGPYRFDPERTQLWRGTQIVNLAPKALAVLHHLLAHPSQVVTKEELFRTAWADTVVSDAALTYCIQELRRALRDDAKTPRYIETVHRRGFRFIGKVVSSLPSPTPNTRPLAPTLVGREAELSQLHGWLEKAVHGERQLVFVSGEPGIGKTTLVEAFLHQIATNGDMRIGRGQCIEHYGAGEVYLPVLDALGRLCREPGGKHLLALLKTHAPTWVVQMPTLLSATEGEALRRKVAGATKERMLRELAEAVEVVTAERPLVLWLEDLHWSDVSTLDWLAFVARRRERVRLLVLGTYRPVEVLMREHPLKAVKQELQVHGQCQELPVDFLREEHVVEYLARRLPSSPSPALAGEGWGEGLSHAPLQRLARVIQQRTDGNPLFIVNLVDHLLSQGLLVQTEGQWVLQEEDTTVTVPETLQQMIEQRVAQVNPVERGMLEVASVAGAEFSAAAVATGLENTVEAVEAQCMELVRRELFLRASGTVDWPDGTVATQYSFRHALYQEVLYKRLPAGRRVRLHRQIGEREERAYGERAREIAAELALHFERGREYRKAVQHLQQAGDNALRRSAYHEAITLLTKGLELLQALPDTLERTQQELLLQATLGAALTATKGYAAAEVVRAYGRAQELCSQVSESPQLFPILWGLLSFYTSRAEFQSARTFAEQCLRLAQRLQDSGLLLQAHLALGTNLLWRGEFVDAQAQFEQGMTLYRSQPPHSQRLLDGQDPGVWCLCFAACALSFLGYPDRALTRVEEGLTLAHELAHPHTLALPLNFASVVYMSRGHLQLSQTYAEALLTLATEQGFSWWVAIGTRRLGYVRVLQGQTEAGMAQIRQSLAAYQITETVLNMPDLLLDLAVGYWIGGQAEEGLSMVAEALAVVDRTGERLVEVWLWWVRGELTLQQENQKSKVKGQKPVLSLVEGSKISNTQHPTPSTPAEAEAEAYFHKAIEIARQQQAKSPELRATMSLARLWQQQGKHHAACNILSEIYNWFTEGFDTVDLKEAKGLLEELGG
ncbi:MAG: AAA family ATPase [Deltaproteobacteria bacterium]|nr:AAA family ATPase [Deltaproteobacteria bacterium]